MTPRGRCLAVLCAVTPLGFYTKLYSGPDAAWVAEHAGGLLYVVFWIFAALAVSPRLSRLGVSACVLVVTSILEFGQLWHPALLERLRSSFLGEAVLGSTFDWLDFPYYVAGALAAYAAASLLGCGAPRGGRSTSRRGSVAPDRRAS